jgi:hypothetical protein
MILPLNKEMIAAAYSYLRETKPFNTWDIPEASEITFGIQKRRDRHAHYQFKKNSGHHIVISSHLVGSHINLLATLSHEMIHLYMNLSGALDMRSPHGKDFQKLADRICKIHNFDRLTF